MLSYLYKEIIREDYMKKDKVVIWGDVVRLKDLIISIVISIVSTMGLFFMANNANTSVKLFMGLLGAVIGFIVNSIIFKPKRDIKEGK